MEPQTSELELAKLRAENEQYKYLMEAAAEQMQQMMKERIILIDRVQKLNTCRENAEAVANVWNKLYVQATANFEYVNARLIQLQGGQITVN
jgi:phage tail tape-measure protein